MWGLTQFLSRSLPLLLTRSQVQEPRLLVWSWREGPRRLCLPVSLAAAVPFSPVSSLLGSSGILGSGRTSFVSVPWEW